MIHYLSAAFGSKIFYDFQKIKHSIFNLPGFDIYNHLRTEDDIYKTCQNDYEKQFLKNKPHDHTNNLTFFFILNYSEY